MAKKIYSEEELKLHKQYSKETKKQAVWKNKLTQGFKKWKDGLQEQPTEEQEIEKDLETEDVDKVEGAEELEAMKDAIIEVLDEEDLEEAKEEIDEEPEDVIDAEEVEEVEELDESQKIDSVFTMRESPVEMRELFESLDVEIRKIKGVNFKTTTLDLVYQTMGMNFLRIRPMIKNLTIMTAPEYYKGIVKITEEKEIDEAMVSVKESYEYIKEKRSKKQ